MIAVLVDKKQLWDKREITVIKSKCAYTYKNESILCRSMNKNHLELKMDLCHKTLTYHWGFSGFIPTDSPSNTHTNTHTHTHTHTHTYIHGKIVTLKKEKKEKSLKECEMCPPVF